MGSVPGRESEDHRHSGGVLRRAKPLLPARRGGGQDDRVVARGPRPGCEEAVLGLLLHGLQPHPASRVHARRRSAGLRVRAIDPARDRYGRTRSQARHLDRVMLAAAVSGLMGSGTREADAIIAPPSRARSSARLASRRDEAMAKRTARPSVVLGRRLARADGVGGLSADKRRAGHRVLRSGGWTAVSLLPDLCSGRADVWTPGLRPVNPFGPQTRVGIGHLR